MEKWKAVPDYEGYYEVSDAGRHRSIVTKFGRHRIRALKQGDRRGYRNATLCVDSAKRTFAIHRMVWEAFVGPIPEGMQINHKNGVKDDNRLENLEVVTPSENTLHKFRVLGQKGQKNPNHGEKNGRAKVTNKQVGDIIAAYRAGGISQQKLADTYGVHQTAISRIVRGVGWAI